MVWPANVAAFYSFAFCGEAVADVYRCQDCMAIMNVDIYHVVCCVCARDANELELCVCTVHAIYAYGLNASGTLDVSECFEQLVYHTTCNGDEIVLQLMHKLYTSSMFYRRHAMCMDDDWQAADVEDAASTRAGVRRRRPSIASGHRAAKYKRRRKLPKKYKKMQRRI